MGEVISTRNGVPPETKSNGAHASDPPGGIPRTQDPDPRPHADPAEGGPETEATDLPANEPPPVPPRREAQRDATHRSHHRSHHGQR